MVLNDPTQRLLSDVDDGVPQVRWIVFLNDFKSRSRAITMRQWNPNRNKNLLCLFFVGHRCNEPCVQVEEQQKDFSHGLTKVQVMVNLMKCAVGAGSFSVPYAFKACIIIIIIVIIIIIIIPLRRRAWQREYRGAFCSGSCLHTQSSCLRVWRSTWCSTRTRCIG